MLRPNLVLCSKQIVGLVIQAVTANRSSSHLRYCRLHHTCSHDAAGCSSIGRPARQSAAGSALGLALSCCFQ